MVRYMDQHGAPLTSEERDRLLFWFVQAGMWGRFSGSTESYIDQDLEAIKGEGDAIGRLLEQLRLWHGGLRTEPGHFNGWSLGARFYPVLYMLTRMGEANDWGTGLPLKQDLLGKMSRLEVHHIFPKAQLYKVGMGRSEVNALANFCFLTKDTNLRISDRLPEDYFPEIEARHPGVLATQWIPQDPELWKIANYREFLAERRRLLAAETNRQMEELLHGDTQWLDGAVRDPLGVAVSIPGGINGEDEESEIAAINGWVESHGLPMGEISFDYNDSATGEQLAVFDLAWPNGLQQELSQSVAVLLNEGGETLAVAASAGYRCFTKAPQFYRYLESEILSLDTLE